VRDALYTTAALLGDVQAARKAVRMRSARPLAERLARRAAGRATGRALGRLGL
jgi:hypothetical protein